ncbi:MAG: AAA family ATPase [Candidatus Competibacteraceae bacterium]|nr:AAA family ATPase [Candidatus Competibacteraceae bacterium]
MPSLLDRIRFRQYRSFRDESMLELRRVTLLYGTNNSGKSAVARVLPWLAESLESAGARAIPGLNLRSQVLRDAGFRQVLWAGALADDEKPQIEFELEGRGARMRVALGWIDEWFQPAILEFAATSHTDSVAAEWQRRREDRQAETRRFLRRDTNEVLQIGFHGLLPSCTELPWLQRVHDAFLPLCGGVTWLGPVRQGPGRHFSIDVGPGILRDNGSDAQLLAHADSELLRRVSSFYEELDQLRLDIQTLDTALVKLRLSRTRDFPFYVDFPDTGEGLQQLFSVLVGLEQLRGGVPGILVVEEPDSHLHPQAQRQLAARITEIVRETTEAQIVLETHSEVLLTAIQTEVAAQRLSPSDVAFHWIDQDIATGASAIALIELDEQGRFVSNEFHVAFRHIGELRQALLNARKGSHAR